MLSTIIFVALFLGLLIVSFVLWMAFLRLGLRWAKVEGVTTRRLVVATMLVFVVQAVLRILSHVLLPSTGSRAALGGFAVLVAAVLLPCLIIARIFKSRFVRSLQAWLPTLVPSIAMVSLGLFVVRPYLVEAFYSPGNAMAPTLLGSHYRGLCPECGGPSIVCAPPYPTRGGSHGPQPTICRHFHMSSSADYGLRLFGPDRVLVAKYLAPRRWDLVVFRSPRDPSTLYVKRVVGLPGEQIHLDQGAAWADGRKLTPPESIRGITYVSEPSYAGRKMWGSLDNPARLAADEYFVLGDFSANSEDSRFWAEGAPDHHPFAVPASYVCGVVTHIYWPPQRWRILR